MYKLKFMARKICNFKAVQVGWCLSFARAASRRVTLDFNDDGEKREPSGLVYQRTKVQNDWFAFNEFYQLNFNANEFFKTCGKEAKFLQ